MGKHKKYSNKSGTKLSYKVPDEEQRGVVESTSNSPCCLSKDLGGNVAGNSTASTGVEAREHEEPTGQKRPVTTKTVAASTKGPLRKLPRCSRCRNHGILVPLKGHKKYCSWKNCNCASCVLISTRQKVMAQQIALQREQTIKEMTAMAMQQANAAVIPAQLDEYHSSTCSVSKEWSSNAPQAQSAVASHMVGQSTDDVLVNHPQGIPQTHNIHTNSQSNTQLQWENSGRSNTQPSSDIASEIPIHFLPTNETDLPYPIFGGSPSHGGGSGNSSYGTMMAFSPFSNYSHSHLPFSFGLSTMTPKFSPTSSQVYASDLLHFQQQQQQLQQYRVQGNNFGGNFFAPGGNGSAVQSAFMPFGQQGSLVPHQSTPQREEMNELTPPDSLEDDDDILVLDESRSNQTTNSGSTSCVAAPHVARIGARTIYQAFPSLSSTTSEFHPLPATANPVQARSFIPLQCALFPPKHASDSTCTKY